jgi:hypothetical protein
MPLAPVYKVEHAFARLGRWRRLSRCYEGTGASALAWHQVVCVVYLFVPLKCVAHVDGQRGGLSRLLGPPGVRRGRRQPQYQSVQVVCPAVESNTIAAGCEAMGH